MLRYSLAISIVFLAACGNEGFISGPGSNHDGGVAGDSHAWPSGQEGGPIDPQPGQDASCGGQNIPIKLEVKGDIPDLHLVVDKSGSMFMPIDIFQLQLGNKWDAMRKTLGALVDYYQANIRFGLTLYPGDAACAAGGVDAPLQMGNAGAIKAKLNLFPDGSTPTHTTLAAVRAYLKTAPPGKGPRYALLATDGLPNCGADPDSDTGPETLAEVQALAADGVKVFIVGFGSIFGSNPGLLDQLAVAGGAPNPQGPHKFYLAADEKQLQEAFFNIAGGIIPPPCTYSLTTPPPEPDKVTVTFDGTPVPRSASSSAGWNYTGGGSEITFFGPACEMLRQGKVKQVDFLYGCKGPQID